MTFRERAIEAMARAMAPILYHQIYRDCISTHNVATAEKIASLIATAALDAYEKLAREEGPDDLRTLGWSVAVHNDYRMAGESMTFWLFTHADGQWIKGEGRTDAEALSQDRAMLAARPKE